MNNLFTPDDWIQDPPNSPDIAYQIQTLWATVKKSQKEKSWNLSSFEKNYPKLVRRYCLNFLKRIKKIIEINGNRLELFHLNQIKKEIDDELGKEVENDEYNDYETKIGEGKD